MGEHVFSGKVIASVACETDRPHNPANRVQCALRRSDGQSLCEHVLTGRLIASVACRTDRPHNPAIRVRPSARTTG